MRPLERQLIGMGLVVLLTLALTLTGDGMGGWLFWPVLIGGAALWHRIPVEGPSRSASVTEAPEGAPTELSCSAVWDWDVGDCA